MMRKIIVLICISFMLVTCLGVLIHNSEKIPDITPINSEYLIQGDWMILGSKQNLLGNSTFVVLGTITSSSQYNVTNGPINHPSKLVMTAHTLKIEKTLYGKVDKSEIIIRQTGGYVGKNLIQFAEAPLFKIGDKLIIFVKEYEPGQYLYWEITGRYHVFNDKVYSLGEVDSYARPMVATNLNQGGKSVQDFQNWLLS